jgi:hypothetical protein
VVVLALSLLAPAFVAIDKAIQLRRLDRERAASLDVPAISAA